MAQEAVGTVDLYRNQQSTTTQTGITHKGSSITSGGSTSLTATKTLNVQAPSIEGTRPAGAALPVEGCWLT